VSWLTQLVCATSHLGCDILFSTIEGRHKTTNMLRDPRVTLLSHRLPADTLTTHQQNTIERVPLRADGSARQVVAGEPFDEQLVGPSSSAWGRRPGDYGRIAYVTTDGGLVAPPRDDIVRPARLLRAELPAAERAPDIPRT
jgi:hypothetical protein